MIERLPFISKQAVRAVLDGMLYGTSSGSGQSLEYLTLVEHFVQERQLPQVDNRRQFAVRSLLSESISRNLERCRSVLGLAAQAEDDTLKAAQRCMQLDVRSQSAELIGWSILYYRYVRADLNVTLNDYGREVHMDERTLRRYQAHAIGRLRDSLTDEEAAARRAFRRLKLYAAIPGGVAAPVIGRDKILRETRQLMEGVFPQHIQITGARGVGKTTFVKLLLREHIESDEIDQLIWFDSVERIDAVREYLQQVTMRDTQTGLAEYLLRYRVVLVLDDIQNLEKGALRRLLNEVSYAVIYMTSVAYVRLSPDCQHVVVTELDQGSVAEIIRANRVESMSGDETVDYEVRVWNQVGGNPLAVKLLVNTLNNVAAELSVRLGKETLKQIFAASFEALSLGARRVLFMLVLLPARSVAGSELERVWPKYTLTGEHFVELTSCGLIHAFLESDKYILADGLRSLARELSDKRPEVQLLIDELVLELGRSVTEGDESIRLCFDAVERLLWLRWPEVPENRELAWVDVLCEEGIRRRHFAAWEVIISRAAAMVGELSYRVQIAYAVCLRRLSRWQEAQDTLESMIRLTGEKGAFSWQGRGLVEYAALLRQQGFYDQALAALKQGEVISERYGDVHLTGLIGLERAQIALDAGSYEDVLEWLGDKVGDNIRVLVLLSEANAALGNLEQARMYADRAVRYLGESSSDVGRLYSNLGRICVRQGDLMLAERFLTTAITVLEQEGDLYALARAKSNLAVILMNVRRDYGDARDLLLEASDAQVMVGDQVGLAYTKHNLGELDRIMVDESWDRNTMDLS